MYMCVYIYIYVYTHTCVALPPLRTNHEDAEHGDPPGAGHRLGAANLHTKNPHKEF